MLPVIAILGRPNVGKSTLFNRLTRTRDALVADVPGLTRDRQYGIGRVGPCSYIVVDTGGISGEVDGIDHLMTGQSLKAFEECDIALLVVDGRAGVTAADQQLASEMRRAGKRLQLLVNKAEGQDRDMAAAEFHALGMGEPWPISAAHGDNIAAVMEELLADFPDVDEAPDADAERVRVTVIGRPNVGKSTLINRLLGEDRLVAFDKPGTTRDAVAVPFERDGKPYTLVDTAGVRRRRQVTEAIEKFSIVKTLQAIEQSHVVVVVFDASEGITEQDLGVLGAALDAGRAVVIAINKWDGLSTDQRERIKSEVDRRLNFIVFARTHFISALHGSGVGDLIGSVDEAFESATRELVTPELTRILEAAVTQHQPPLVRGRRIKLRYAHQGGRLPPIVVIHGNQTERVPAAYTRYLSNYFREKLRLFGTPIRIEYKSGVNPFAGRKNKLTPRQQQRKKRMMRHVKKGKK